MSARHVLLTGPPAVGKTTLVSKLVDALKSGGLNVRGFITEEVREGGQRVGFDVVVLGDGARVPLARLEGKDKAKEDNLPRVGRFVVDTAGFESAVLPLLELPDGDDKPHVLAVDEIGKMELFSSRFVTAMGRVLRQSHPVVVGTVAAKGGGLIAEVKQLPNVRVVTLHPRNRDALVHELAAAVAESVNLPAPRPFLLAQPVHTATLCVVPPVGLWEPIQAIRRVHDRATYHRWMPHLNVLYPFVPHSVVAGGGPGSVVADAVKAAHDALASLPPFSCTLESFGTFSRGKRSPVVFVGPDSAATAHFQTVYAKLRGALPHCAPRPELVPHLTVGDGWPTMAEALAGKAELEKSWQPVTFEVTEALVMSRDGVAGDFFRVTGVVRLGGNGFEVFTDNPLCDKVWGAPYDALR